MNSKAKTGPTQLSAQAGESRSRATSTDSNGKKSFQFLRGYFGGLRSKPPVLAEANSASPVAVSPNSTQGTRKASSPSSNISSSAANVGASTGNTSLLTSNVSNSALTATSANIRTLSSGSPFSGIPTTPMSTQGVQIATSPTFTFRMAPQL